MKKVILTKGLQGSGKTTWAKQLQDENKNQYKRINKDDLRQMLDNKHFSKGTEEFILQCRDALILMALENGKNVIIDDTNFAEKHINRITQLVKGKAKVEIKDFTGIPIETCIERDLKRINSVGEKVIRQTYKQFLAPKQETIKHNPELPDVILCDLDGTLCLLNGRNPYDASTCENDLLNPIVYELIKDKNIIFVSGREDKYREQTNKFLEKHKIGGLLFMRKSGDMRKDSIIKKEIFDNEIRDKFNVSFVLDDRNSVVEMWRQTGLTVLQVADGDF